MLKLVKDVFFGFIGIVLVVGVILIAASCPTSEKNLAECKRTARDAYLFYDDPYFVSTNFGKYRFTDPSTLGANITHCENLFER